MRAFLTPLFLFASLLAWGQAYDVPSLSEAQTAELESVVAKWQARQNSNSNDNLRSTGAAKVAPAVRNNRSNAFETARPGNWSDADTWVGGEVPSNDDAVVVKHNVTLTQDAGCATLTITHAGRLADASEVVLTVQDDVVANGAMTLQHSTLVVTEDFGTSTIEGLVVVDRMELPFRSSVLVNGDVTITGNLGVTDGIVTVNNTGTLRLTENEHGLATITTETGDVQGQITRVIDFNCNVNYPTTFPIYHQFVLGLNGVKVADLIDDLPSFGFPDSDDPGFFFPSLAQWNSEAGSDSIPSGMNDVLKSNEGIHLLLPANLEFTLEFSGTLPNENKPVVVPDNIPLAFVGNPTNGNLKMERLQEAMGDGLRGVACWNPKTIQYDIYTKGASTNGLNGLLQPTRVCSFHTTGSSFDMTLNLSDLVANGEPFVDASAPELLVAATVSNSNGLSDEAKIVLTEDAQDELQLYDDAKNVTSSGNIDIYWTNADDAAGASGWAIPRLRLDESPMLAYDLVIKSINPIITSFSVDFTEVNLGDFCAYFELRESGEMVEVTPGTILTVELASNAVNTPTVGTLYLVPPVKAETVSPGCEGEGEASVSVKASGDGPWSVSLTDANGNNVVGVADAEGVVTSFADLASGTYAYTVVNNGTKACGSNQGQVAVVRPTALDIQTTVSNNCGEGGAALAQVEGTDVTFAWSNGQTGALASDLAGGMYNVVATDAFGCKDTTEVEVLATPDLDVTVVSPGCDGEGLAGFTMNSQDNVTWNVAILDATGAEVNAFTVSDSESVTGLASGEYSVTASNDVEDGCPAKSMTASLVEVSDLTVDFTTTPMECGDINTGAIELSVNGGFGAVRVDWDHGAEGTTLTDLAGGQYHAVVSDDNGCTKEVRVELEETPTVEADFALPTAGLTAGGQGATMSFTNTSEGNITGQTWYFEDTDTPSYDFHATHTFDEAGAYDVFLNVWNDKCSHTVRKTVVVSQGNHGFNNADDQDLVTRVMEGDLTDLDAPTPTASGWTLNLGAAADGMKVHVFDLTGRQLCNPVPADGNGQIWVEGNEWPAMVLVRLVHEPTNSVRTWKMVR